MSTLNVETRTYVIVSFRALLGNGGELFLEPFNGGAAQPVFIYSLNQDGTRRDLRVNENDHSNRLRNSIAGEGDRQERRLFAVVLSIV